MIKSSLNEGLLTIYLEGHVDSNNASNIETEIGKICDENPHEHIRIDAEDLTYLSSAGLRILLRLRKADTEMSVVNVSSEVYEILEMTGFTEMIHIEKGYRKMSVDGCEVLGSGSNGIVYRYDPEIVVKVYRNPDALDDIRRERELARKALILGIPTAIPFDVVKVGDKYASVFELLNAKSFSKLIKAEPEKLDYYVGLFVDLLKQIHSTEIDPKDMPNMKTVAVGWVEFLEKYLPADQYARLYALVNAVEDRHTMIHGDYHTNNVEMQNGEVMLIDMDTLSYGHPVFELGSMFLGFVGFGPETIEQFMKMPYETTTKIWAKTLKLYLGSDDEEYIKSVEDKAKIVGYARLMRRTIRRIGLDTEEGKSIVDNCKTQLADLLGRVETLEF